MLISTSDGNEYLIGFSYFNKNIISFEGHEFLGDTDIIEIVLKRQKGNGVSNEALFKIIDRIWEVVHDRKSSIFYFYCDDMHDIARRKNNWSPNYIRWGREDTKEGGWRHTRREGYKGWEPAPFYWVSRVYDHSMSRTNRTEEVRRLYRVNVRPLLNSTIHPELELCSELDQ